MPAKLSWSIAKERAEKKCVEKNLIFLGEEKDWVNARGYVRVACREHGEYQIMYDNLVNKPFACKPCGFKASSKKQRNSLTKINEIFNREDYKVIGEYENNRLVSLMCPVGHECKIALGNFQRGDRCQVCKEEDGLSGGARNVQLVLEELKLCHDSEFRTDEMPMMPYDFIVSYDNKALFIEYDGEVHFSGWMGDEEHKLVNQRRDKKKTDFIRFLPSNFYMIRISKANKKHIKHILERFLAEKDFPKIFFDDPDKYAYLM